MLDGLGQVDRLVAAAASRGFEHLALTDHGTLANAVAFIQACEHYGIKGIIGVEGYVQYQEQTGHITILADGENGFQNIVKLQNRAHSGSTGRRPAFTLETLEKYSDHLVCLTGCVSSPLMWLDPHDASVYAARLKSIFGPRVFGEIMFVSDTDTWSRPLQIMKAMGIKPVITNDVHFPYQTDYEVHPILTSVRGGLTYNSRQLWLKSGQQLLVRAKRYMDEDIAIEAINRAHRIGHKLRTINLKKEPSLPHIPNADVKLQTFARSALNEKFPRKAKYYKRMQHELAIIKEMDYSAYFLILHDVIRWARHNHVRVGPGRGSGAGSLLLYLLGVTDVDPLQYGLSFERFLHPQRRGFPDVDIDFDSDGRQRVIDYAKDMWDAHPIAVYSTYSHASLVHDVAKMLKLPKEEEIEAADKGEDSAVFKKLVSDEPLFGKAYDVMRDQIRHRGKHAGGVIITDGIVPIEKAGDSLVAAWTDGKFRQLSYAGIIKFDFLGLTALTALKRMEDETGEKAADPGECEETMDLFRRGDLIGIFQFTGSTGIADLTVKVAPTSFDDLVAINALYRPGALDVGSADAYPKWKSSPRSLHPFIDDILEPTYGAIVFQEQVMEIFARVTGGSLAEADVARRAIIKSKVKDPEWERTVANAESQFLAGAKKSGLGPKVARRIWKELFSHVRYSFNRAHAVAYCMISWEMAWWKTHHPVLFYATMMDADPYEFQTYLFDAAEHDIEVVTPHVNVSSTRFEYDDDSIYLPFNRVKFLGLPGAEALVKARGKDLFVSYEDFADRVARRAVTSRSRLGLYVLGGFEGLEGSPLEAGIDTSSLIMGEEAYDVQRRHLGAVLPSASIIRKIAKWRKKDGVTAGVIKSKKRKTSKWGPYVVYQLVPDGVFWVRDGPSFEVGEVVAAKVNQRTRRLLRTMKI
jgi:DNA polymerase-3 subunit alpha